jgi:hypothetical protein
LVRNCSNPEGLAEMRRVFRAGTPLGLVRFFFDQLHSSLAGGSAVPGGMDDVLLPPPPLDPDLPLDLGAAAGSVLGPFTFAIGTGLTPPRHP